MLKRPSLRDLPVGTKRVLRYRVANPGRFIVDVARQRLPFRSQRHPARPLRALLVSDAKVITSEEQFYPFQFRRESLRQRLNLVSVHLLVDDVLRAGAPLLSQFDVVFLKLGFLTDRDRAERVVNQVATSRGSAKLVYMDGDDDSAVQWPSILPALDLYVKKHVFRDRGVYGTAFVGKNNLTDYTHRTFGVSFDNDPIPASVPVPMEQRAKIVLGYNIAMDSKMCALYADMFARGTAQERPNDVVSRATVNEQSWLFHLRKQVIAEMQRMPPEIKALAPTARVAQDQYYQEMLSSKICVSPLGYGEICWRDFEAVICGCLLVKPDMGHIETNPDIFMAGETYVPVRWDYSDLADKCAAYLRDDAERQRIVGNARRVLSDFYENDGFVQWVSSCLATLGLR